MNDSNQSKIDVNALKGEVISLDKLGIGTIVDISKSTLKCKDNTVTFSVEYSDSIHNCPYPSTFLRSNTIHNSNKVNAFIKQQFGNTRCEKCGYLIDKRAEKAIYNGKHYCQDCSKKWFRCPICRHVVPYHKTIIESSKVYICSNCYKSYFVSSNTDNVLQPSLHNFDYYKQVGWSEKNYEDFIYLCDQIRSILVLLCFEELDLLKNHDLYNGMNKYGQDLFSILLLKIADLYCPDQKHLLTEYRNELIYSSFLACMPKSFTNWPYGNIMLEENAFREYIEGFFDSMKLGIVSFIQTGHTDADEIHEITKTDYDKAISSYSLNPDFSMVKDYTSMCRYHDKLDFMDTIRKKLSKLDGLFAALPNKQSLSSPTHDQANSANRILYVSKGKIKCEIESHDIESVSIDVTTHKHNKAKLNASYCRECNLLFIHYDEYERFRAFYGLPNIRFLPMQSEQSPFDKWEDYSVLNLAGYNVNEKTGLSEKERQDILIYLVKNGILPKYQIINYLNQFIALRKDNPSMENAIEKWESDLAFIRNYNFDNQQKFHADDIKKYR